jgi:SAM-dependent methyltransferase
MTFFSDLLSRKAAAAPAPTVACKICGGPTRIAFALPQSKLTGQPIPDAPDDCPYYECTRCEFLFCTQHDTVDHAALYDDDYWKNQDPDWHGRVGQTLRLVLLSNFLLGKDPSQLDVLDFGCGMGCFVESARRDLQLRAWGSDLITPRFGREFFVGTELPAAGYDVVVACEVIEHLGQPMEAFAAIARSLKRPGAFAFQTAYYDPAACDRTWWYLGPANGHISLHSARSLERAAEQLGVARRVTWAGYPGVQAWLFN